MNELNEHWIKQMNKQDIHAGANISFNSVCNFCFSHCLHHLITVTSLKMIGIEWLQHIKNKFWQSKSDKVCDQK